MRARRLRRALAALLAVAGLFVPFIVGVPTAYDGEPVFVAIPVEHVNTLIGTGTGAAIVGEINNFPGASVPFGMVQYSPDTVDNYAGYDYDNPHSTGFSMTHASVGCPAFGDISMLPTTTPLGSQPWSAWEEIAHDDTEVGVPGYYTVRFPGTGVIAELTATTRTGVGRFRYPRNGWPALFHVRSGASLAGNYAATLQIEDNTTITGSATSGGFCGKKNLYTVYFAMKFSQPFSSYGTWDGYAVYPGSHSMNSSYSGGYVGFPAGSVLEVRTALSYVSVDGARANLDAEGGASFDDIRAATSSEWNAALSRIAVAGRGPGDVDTFYTCLYRSLLHPNTFNDVDRTLHRIRRCHPQRCQWAHPLRQFLRLGHLPQPRPTAGTVVPATGQRHDPVVGDRRGAEWCVSALGAGEFRNRHDERRQCGTAHRKPLRLRRQGFRPQIRAALHGECSDPGRCRT